MSDVPFSSSYDVDHRQVGELSTNASGTIVFSQDITYYDNGLQATSTDDNNGTLTFTNWR